MSHFKIALINPKDSTIPISDYAVYENLGLACLAAALRKNNYSVKIIDGYAENLDHTAVAEKAVAFAPDLVGFTCTYQSYPDVVSIGKLINRSFRPPHITIGGEHATYTSDHILDQSEMFDSVVRGEGEESLLELVFALEAKRSLESVRGIQFKRNGIIVKNPDRPGIEDLDKLPFASRDTMDYCLNSKKPALIGMLASRGCYNSCSFCNANKFFRLGGGKSLRKRTPRNVVDELSRIFNDYISRGLQAKLYFYDANFVNRDPAGKQWAREIAEGMIENGIYIPFEIFARADSFSDTKEDDDLISTMKKAGLESIFIGFESGSEDVLSSYNKGVSAAQNKKAVEILRRHEVLGVTNGFIMFGPYVNFQGLREGAEFLLHTKQASFWNMSQRLQLFPGIALIERLKEEKLLKSDYSPCNVYGYEFKDPRVGKLAEKIDFNSEPVTRRENALVRYVTETSDNLDKLALQNGMHTPSSLRLKEEISGKTLELSRLNYSFFCDLIDLAECRWSEPEYREKKIRYLETMSKKLESLEQSFKYYLECFN